MSDIPRTLREQPGSPDAQASGDAARPSPDTGSDQRPAPVQGHSPKGGDEDAAEVQGDLAELVKTAAERDEYLALAQRTQADFENFGGGFERVGQRASVVVVELLLELGEVVGFVGHPGIAR